MATMIQSDIRSALQMASAFAYWKPSHSLSLSPGVAALRLPPPLRLTAVAKVRAFSNDGSVFEGVTVEKAPNKPSVCTADELHYVSVFSSDWRLALWRYTPPPEAPARNRPLLLLSGVGTNAIGYDLSPGSSFARYMCGQGFDTWILEVRGAGLSARESDLKAIEKSAREVADQMEASAEAATEQVFPSEQISAETSTTLQESDISVVKVDSAGTSTVWEESVLVTKLTEIFMSLSERLSGFQSEVQFKIMSTKLFDQISRLLEDSFLFEQYNDIRGRLVRLLEAPENSRVTDQIRDLSQRLVNIIEESQLSVSPQLFNLQERFFTTIEDFQKQLDLIEKYDWDFDHYLEEDVPAVMDYIKAQTKPKDGKLLAIGHSMGGILLYARLSRCAFEGRDPGLAAVVTLASSLDYTSSKSSLKLLLPLADPAQALNVPVVPLGALLSAAYPLSSQPPYVLSWLNNLISSEDMMHPELLRKLVLNNFCTIPAKLLLQLTTAFREGGLRDRSGTFFYKDHLKKTQVPVLALAGDQDLICPPEAAYETANLLPQSLVTYKVFGQIEGPHYAHYDLVGGRLDGGSAILKFIIAGEEESRGQLQLLTARGQMTDACIRAAVEAIHSTPTQSVLYLSGGASQALGWLMSVPGASNTVLEAVVPYSRMSMIQLLGKVPTQFASHVVAEEMALLAYNRALKLSKPGSPALGVGFTGSLATARSKLGDHRFHLSTRTSERHWVSTVTLSKGLRNREEEDKVSSHVLLKAIANACKVPGTFVTGLTEFEVPDEFEEHFDEDQELEQLISGQICFKVYPFSREAHTSGAERKIILSGSFNPLHEGHLKLQEVASSIIGDGYPCFELSAINADKPPLTISQIKDRVKQFEEVGKTVIVSNQPYFYKKAELFPGSTFVIGADTAARLINPKYYGGDYGKMVEILAGCKMMGTNFLVGGRNVDGIFKVLEDFDVPVELRDMFISIPTEKFRMDISSTEIRKNRGL